MVVVSFNQCRSLLSTQGKIIGGVIGTDIVRYDIYGRDVVIANKMESSGEQGRILVSSTTRKLLEQSTTY